MAETRKVAELGDDNKLKASQVPAGLATTEQLESLTAADVGADPAGTAAAAVVGLVDSDDPRLTDARTPTTHGNDKHSASYVDAAGAAAAAPVQSVDGSTGAVSLSGSYAPWPTAVEVPLTAFKASVGTWTPGSNTSGTAAPHTLQSLNTVAGDEVSYDVPMKAGTWTFRLVGFLNTVNGIITVQVDGVTVGTVDLYGGAGTTMAEITGIAVAATGVKTLRLAVLGKNASSSSHAVRIDVVSLHKTA